MNYPILISFLVYLIAVLYIGYYFSKKNETLSDYFLGGRKLGSWVIAMSAQASDMSGWLLMGLPGAAYLSGLVSGWIAIGLAIGTYLNWKFVAARLRKFSQAAGDAITIPQYFQNRFDAQTPILGVVCAIIIFVFFLVYTASGFSAAAKLFESVFKMDYVVGLTIGMLVITGYTFMGGFLAVCWTDFFQGLLMIVAIIAVPIVASVAIGAVGFESTAGHWSFMASPNGSPASAAEIISNLGWALGYFGMPHILVRFMAIKTSAEIKKARKIAMWWVVFSLTAAVLVGIVGYAYYNGAIAAGNEEKVFMELIMSTTPGFIAGILLCAVISAIMSTADSQLLVTASAVSNDIYKAVIKKDASDKQMILISKLGVALVAVIAYIIALDPTSSVMGLVSYAWAGFGASFGPVILFSLFWKKTTMHGALAGMVSGALGVILWEKFLAASTGLYSLPPAFALSAVLIVVFSLLDGAPSAEVEAIYDRAINFKEE